MLILRTPTNASVHCEIVAPERGRVGIGHRLKHSGRLPSAGPEQNTIAVVLRAVATVWAGDETATEIAVLETGTCLSRHRRLQFVFNPI
jgi:hypothetical protein